MRWNCERLKRTLAAKLASFGVGREPSRLRSGRFSKRTHRRPDRKRVPSFCWSCRDWQLLPFRRVRSNGAAAGPLLTMASDAFEHLAVFAEYPGGGEGGVKLGIFILDLRRTSSPVTPSYHHDNTVVTESQKMGFSANLGRKPGRHWPK